MQTCARSDVRSNKDSCECQLADGPRQLLVPIVSIRQSCASQKSTNRGEIGKENRMIAIQYNSFFIQWTHVFFLRRGLPVVDDERGAVPDPLPAAVCCCSSGVTAARW